MITEIAEERRLPDAVIHEPQEEAVPAKPKREPKAKQPAKTTNAKQRPARDLWPIAARALLLACAFMVVIFIWHTIDQFLIGDPRFVLAAPTESGEPGGLRVEGIRHTTRAQVDRVFREDFGRSIYLVDMTERRRMLLGIPWVKDASVARSWPNHVVVRVTERKPFANALLTIPNENETATRVVLVDQEAVVLETIEQPKVELPLLRGLSLAMRDVDRKARVARAQRMLREAGELADGISEIDVADPENLKVTRPAGDRALTFFLGRDQFRARLEHFYTVVDQIRKDHPNRTIFDLRTKDIMGRGEKAE